MNRKKQIYNQAIGRFITLEGGEGCGKTTQLDLLVRELKVRGYDCTKVHEPGGTELGEELRSILLNSKKPIDQYAEMLLYMASRAQLVREVIAPALRDGKIVLSDRWMDATYAYQGAGLGLDSNLIRKIERPVTDGISPDLTLILDLPVKRGLIRARKRSRLDRIESRSVAFHERVRKHYRSIPKRNHKAFLIKPMTIEKTHELILARVLNVI